MKITLLAAVAALSLTAAHAETEGSGNPFALHTPGITLASPRAYADTGSSAYPDLSNPASQVVVADVHGMMAATGREAIVQTLNSLPRGFVEGTVTRAQELSVQYHLADQAIRPVEDTQATFAQGGKSRR